jgi:hypothetical protein
LYTYKCTIHLLNKYHRLMKNLLTKMPPPAVDSDSFFIATSSQTV